MLRQNGRVSISAITGMGGIGKTELALKYIEIYQDDYPGSLCWFSVREQSLATQIIGFSRTYFNYFPPEELESELDRVKSCWNNWCSEKSLIVLDDVPNYGKFYGENIAPYLPPSNSNIKFLMTSRERPGSNIKRIDLDVLTEKLALELIAVLIGKDRVVAELDLAEELCQWLGYLPLGLELVGRYMDLDENLTIEKTLKRLIRQQLEAKVLLTPEQADMNAQLGVAAAFDLSWEMLSEAAQELGCYLSLFGSEPFDWSLVESALIKAEDENKREDQIEELEELRNKQFINRSLLNPVPENQTYQFHSLIAQYLRTKLDKRDSAAEFKKIFCLSLIDIAKSIPEAPTQYEIQTFSLAIFHLSIIATEFIGYVDDEMIIELFTGLGRFYEGQGVYSQAEDWYKLSLNKCRQRLGEEHLDVAHSLNNLALMYQAQGKYNSAEPLHLQALELTKKLLGDEHIDVAISLNNLAKTYKVQGRYEEAEALFLQALDMRKKLLGEEHSHVALSLNDIAGIYIEKGKLKKAEPLYLQSLELYKKLLGKEHPYVAIGLNNLAYLYDLQGKLEKAEPLYLQSLEIRRNVLGDEHPSVATSLNNLASLYYSQRRLDEAEPFYLQALDMRKQLLGDEHPDVATSLNNLAYLYHFQGRLDEAEHLYAQALDMRRKLLGDEHPDVAMSLHNLAGLYYFQGRLDEAECLYAQALELLKNSLGEDHSKTRKARIDLHDFIKMRRQLSLIPLNWLKTLMSLWLKLNKFF